MRLLLDTHAAVAFLEDDPRLGAGAAAALEDPGNQVLLSAVVVWEIAIKRAIGKLPVDQRYLSLLLDGGVEPLAISLEHARAVEELPPHHRDPFDRLLVAQAAAESATIVTNDERIREWPSGSNGTGTHAKAARRLYWKAVARPHN